MKITKRQLRRIVKEEKRRLISEAALPQGALEEVILEIFYDDGQVTTADVFDRLRMYGHTDEEIDAAMTAITNVDAFSG
jgi:hypothetical protein